MVVGQYLLCAGIVEAAELWQLGHAVGGGKLAMGD